MNRSLYMAAALLALNCMRASVSCAFDFGSLTQIRGMQAATHPKPGGDGTRIVF